MAQKPNYELHEEQLKANQKAEAQFMAQLKLVRPEIWVLADLVDQTGVNPFILWKVGYSLNHLAQGSGWGQIVVEIQDGTVKIIKGIDQHKVEEPVIVKRQV